MKRPIIVIDREKCNGCGKCVKGCAEGALQIIDGKAVLVKEDYCDGLGACIGDCPRGALKVEMREVPAFSGPNPAAAPVSAPPLTCPGMQLKSMATTADLAPTDTSAEIKQAIPSELRQWPVQLHLVPPSAPFLKERELLLLNACGAATSADVHWRFIRGRAVLIACPKLMSLSEIREKLAAIFTAARPPKVLIARMEVPCCKALSVATHEALKQAGLENTQVTEMQINLNGDVVQVK